MGMKQLVARVGLGAGVIGISLLLLGTTTHASEFGITKARADQDVSTYVHKTFANQVKVYHKIAPKLWPDNKDVNQYAMINDIDNKTFWMVTPTGKVSDLTEKQALSYGVQPEPYEGWF